MKILVKTDVFDICKRIKNFNSTYCVVYDLTTKKYSIYSTKLGSSVELISGRILSYICSLPYNELDERALKYLHDTKVENIEEIISNIEKENQTLEQINNKKVAEISIALAENKLRQLT